jgi:hypothetical protein
LRASKSLTKELVIGAQVMNGWNDVSNNTGGQTLGLTATYTRKLFNWTETYLGGPEPIFLSDLVELPLAARPKRTSQLIDSVVELTPTARLNAYVEMLYGEEKSSPRWESYNDPTGATSGTKQRLQEVTATLQYRPPVNNMLVRFEVRGDFSDQPFFLTGAAAKSKTQATALLALLYTWKPRR